MAGPTWSFQAEVQGSPDEVWRWMTDFAEDDHARPAFRRGAGVPEGDARPSRRRVVARTGDRVELEDTWGRRTFRTVATLDPARREVRVTSPEFDGYGAVWRAMPAPGGGTRVELQGTLAPRGLLGLLAPLFAGKVRRDSEQDFRGHVADLEDALRRSSGPAGKAR